MAESASASITATQLAPGQNQYTITLDDTGSTAIGTFWLGWVPNADFLETSPSSMTAPAGWTAAITHMMGGPYSLPDGFAIQWVAGSPSADLMPGGSRTFSFVSSESPSSILGDTPFSPGTPELTSFVYSGAPFSDAGFAFVVQPMAAPPPPPPPPPPPGVVGHSPDVLWRDTAGDAELWKPNGSGGLTAVNLGAVGSSWQIAGGGNFNGKGDDGILWRNSNGDTELWNDNGAGGFTAQDLGAVGSNWQVAGTGDFNGSGKDGILWRDMNGDVELWTNGAGGFTAENLGAVGSSWQIAGTGDFNGSGKDGILWRNSNGDVELWNNGAAGFTAEDLGVVPTTWQIEGTGDFNGSGRDGVLWRNSNGDVELWNNGAAGFTGQNLGVVPSNWTVAHG